MSEPQYVATTLAWCNERRKEKGKRALRKLPKGVRGNGRSCPCGKATDLFVGGSTYSLHSHTKPLVSLPEAVQEFVEEFDEGRLPQYEESS